LELAHPLRLHGEIATDLGDQALDHSWKVGGSGPPGSSASDWRCGFRHGRILPVRDAPVCSVWNALARPNRL